MQKRSFEQTGLIPRSIIRTFDRFRKQLLPGAEQLVIQEFRLSRYQVLVSFQCLTSLILVPLCINFLAKNFIFTPLTEYFWNTQHTEIFLNHYQQERAYQEIEKFHEQLYFESLIQDVEIADFEKIPKNIEFKEKFHQKTYELAFRYNYESIAAITNIFADLITFILIIFLFMVMKPQIIILKSFLTESIYSLSDTIKSFLLILFTDLLVGFHSPRGWEVFLDLLLRHFGLPTDEDFILLFVATFPVLLDTVFKYWIFRYLNKISPSTVVTYHNMIE